MGDSDSVAWWKRVRSLWLAIGAAVIVVAVVVVVLLLRPTTPHTEPASSLKSPIRGVASRQPAVPAAYQRVVDSYVVPVPWFCLQPDSGDALASRAISLTDPSRTPDLRRDSCGDPGKPGNLIDQAIVTARAAHVRIKLRILAGQYAPNWLKAATRTGVPADRTSRTWATSNGAVQAACPTGTVAITSTTGLTPHVGCVDAFWTPTARAAYAHYQALLAARYDSVDVIGDVEINGCMTIFEEPMLRQNANRRVAGAYASAGYSESENFRCEHDQIDAHRVWVHTPSDLAVNPYQAWTGSAFVVDEAKTEQLMDYCRQQLGERCVLGNDSAGNTPLFGASGAPALYPCGSTETDNGYRRMYSYLRCKGGPIFLQTATAAQITRHQATLPAVLDWAAHVIGAGMVELPAGYSSQGSPVSMTPTQLAPYDAALATQTKG